MKILILLNNVDHTGLTINTIDLCEALVQKGHAVHLLLGYNPNIVSNQLEFLYKRFYDSGATIYQYNSDFSGKSLQKVITKIKSVLFLLMRTMRLKPDVIHSESPYLSFIPWLLGKKFVSTLHVNDLVRRFEYKNATRLIAISEETKRYAIAKFGYKESQIDLVYHGVPKRFSNPIPTIDISNYKKKFNIPNSKIIVGLVASIEKRKGHDILIKAVEQLPEETRNRIVVFFLGSYKSGPYNWLENLIENSLIKKNIVWEQYQDPKPYYDIFDIFVLPSRLEGFGLVVIEAMLANCCVIRSNTEGANDQIEHRATGFIFENEDIFELSNIISEVVLNDTLRKSIAQRGREYALKNFTSDIMAENTIKVYKKVLR